MFYFSSIASSGPRLVDASGHGVSALLSAVLKFFPLDTYDDHPVMVMQRVESDVKRDLKVFCHSRITGANHSISTSRIQSSLN